MTAFVVINKENRNEETSFLHLDEARKFFLRLVEMGIDCYIHRVNFY